MGYEKLALEFYGSFLRSPSPKLWADHFSRKLHVCRSRNPQLGFLQIKFAGFLSYETHARIRSSAILKSMLVKNSGGLELLCNSVKIHEVNVDLQAEENQQLTMKHLLSWVRTNLIKERPEMFMKGDTVRPGVLVLVNDCDWELSGQLDTTLEEKDVIVFISTLHGG